MRKPPAEPPRFNGARIASQRKKMGLKQSELAELMGLSRFHVIRMEQGVSGSWKTLRRVCKDLEIPLAEVLLPEAA